MDAGDALASAMADLSTGRASAPDRIGALVPEHEGLLAAMPGYVPSAGMLMSKLVSLYPHNAGGALPTHQAVIVAFDPGTGQPMALLDGTAITAIRTGACSAPSTCTPNWASSSPGPSRHASHQIKSPCTSPWAWRCRTPQPRRWSSPRP